jgi:hypothetical protein
MIPKPSRHSRNPRSFVQATSEKYSSLQATGKASSVVPEVGRDRPANACAMRFKPSVVYMLFDPRPPFRIEQSYLGGTDPEQSLFGRKNDQDLGNMIDGFQGLEKRARKKKRAWM